MPRGPSTPTPIARASPPLPQPPRDHRSEFQYPAPYRLIGDIEPTLGKQILHVAIAQGEPEVQPDRVPDDWRRKAMSAIRQMGHARTLSDQLLPSDPVAVTMRASGDRQGVESASLSPV